MEGGTFAKLGSRLSAAHVRLKTFATVTRMEHRWFSTSDSCLSAAHIRLTGCDSDKNGA